MVFIDDLALWLFLLPLVSITLIYQIAVIYRKAKNGEFERIKETMKESMVPIGLLGLLIFIFGLWGEFTWTLPGSYNILFDDLFTLLGLLLLMYSISICIESKLQYTGILAFFSGLITIYYGIEGYILGMTNSPIGLLLLYLFYGIAGIFSYPLTLAIDYMIENRRFESWMKASLILFIIFVLLGGIMGGYIGALAIPYHLASAP